MDLVTLLAGIAAALTSAAVIGTYTRKGVRFLAKVGRGLTELAKLPDAVEQLSDSLRALGDNTTARLDMHERELARLATFHPQEMTS